MSTCKTELRLIFSTHKINSKWLTDLKSKNVDALKKAKQKLYDTSTGSGFFDSTSKTKFGNWDYKPKRCVAKETK